MAEKPYYDEKNHRVQNGGRTPRIDYDDDVFYDAIRELSAQGASDTEIAIGLKKFLGFSIAPAQFNHMKHGSYNGWTEEENVRRSFRICQTLDESREDINRIVRATYLRAALGKHKVKSVTKVFRNLKVDGVDKEVEMVQTSENVSEMSPNFQALAHWLVMHDKDWKKRSNGEDLDGEGIPTNIVKGIDVTSWIDKELTELKAFDEAKSGDVNISDSEKGDLSDLKSEV